MKGRLDDMKNTFLQPQVVVHVQSAKNRSKRCISWLSHTPSKFLFPWIKEEWTIIFQNNLV